MQDATVKVPKRRRLRTIAIILLVVLCLAATATSAVFYKKYKDSQDTSQAQQKRLVAQLAKVLDLPEAVPTVVTVANKNKLTNKALAARVEDKDMLLIYSSTKRIVIYRPSISKVIDMLSFESQPDLTAEKAPEKASEKAN